MGAFGAFAPFGLLQFGDVESPAERMHRSMLATVSKAFSVEEGTHVEASAYARALAFASARATLRHAFEQRRPMRAVEMLRALERLYGLSPLPSDTQDARRRAVASRKRISRGSRSESIRNALLTLLGDDFIDLYVVDVGAAPYATFVADHTYPSAPANVGAWDAPDTFAKFFRLLEPIVIVGAPVTFEYENVLGDGQEIGVGERLAVQPENDLLAEAVTITAVASSPLRATATFTKAHDEGAIVRSHAPYWASWRRHFTVIVSAAVAADEGTRSRIDALMERLVRATTTWSIAEESAPSTIGPFNLGSSRLGCVPLGTLGF